MRRTASIIVLSLLATAIAAAASLDAVEGSKSFTARPTFGEAVFELPSAVHWRSTPMADGRYRMEITADVNASAVLANVPQLSARALNRDIACDHAVKVKSAAAKLTGPRALTYDVRLNYTKRLCLGLPMEYPADVACTAKIAVAAQRSVITVDVQGATTPPCRIAGLSPAFSESVYALVGGNVFKRHAIDVAKLLPREFQGVTVDIRTLAIDPKTAVLHVGGEGIMTAPQLAALMTRIEAARFVRY